MTEAIANRPLPDEDIGKDADLLRVARERYTKAIDADQDNREAAIEDLEFLAGEQWPDEIARERAADDRIMLTINRMGQFVRQVTGDMRQNRMAISVKPVDDVADDKIADIFSGNIRQIEYASDAQIAYHHAGENAAQCGIGWFRIVTEYCGDDIFDQDIRIKRIRDPFCVTCDPHAVEPTRHDARYMFVEESVDIETFKARYPDARLEGFDSQERSQSWIGDWLQHETIRVAEYWTKEIETRQIALLSDGRVVDVTEMKVAPGMPWQDNSVGMDGQPVTVVRTRKSYRDKVQMRIINGAEVLEGPFDWPGKWIPIVAVLGEEIHIQDKVVRHGVIRFAKDAQRLYNIWRTAQSEKIALEPKVPWVVTAAMISGYEDIWKDANARNMPYLPFKVDEKAPGLKPERTAPQMGSAAMANEILTASDDMKATTGIYDAALGARSNETSGVAIRARQQESDISTVGYIDNLARAIRHAGRILIDLIPKIYDTERVIRLMNEDETTESATINQEIVDDEGVTHRVNDLRVGKYDVVINTGPSYSTKRDAALEGMIDLIKFAPDIGKLILDILVKNMDWPGAEEISERIRKTLPPGMIEPEEGEEPLPQQPDPEMMKAQADTELKVAEAARKDMETAAKVAKTQAETEALQMETMQKAMETMVANGALEGIIQQQVQAIIAQMLADQQQQQQQPIPAPPMGMQP